MGAYQNLIQVDNRHEYFSDGRCNTLRFVPTPRTQRLIKNCDLLMRKTHGGFALAVDRDNFERVNLYAEDARGVYLIDFAVYTDDPAFRSYTAPYSGDVSELVSVDNRIGDEDHVTDLPLRDAAVMQIGEHEIRERLGGERATGLLVMMLGIEVKKNELDHWRNGGTSVYRLRMDARKTHWKYYFVDQAASPTCCVEDADGEVEFEAITRGVLADGRSAYGCRSTRAISLRERYRYRFQLKEKNGLDESLLIDRLPYADIRYITKDSVESQERLVSEVYVNGW